MLIGVLNNTVCFSIVCSGVDLLFFMTYPLSSLYPSTFENNMWTDSEGARQGDVSSCRKELRGG